MIGLDGSWVLSEQLALYRTLDTWNRARDDKSRALSDAAWRNQYNDLVNRYNRLLQDANRLADVQDRALNGQAGEIAELKATKALLNDEIERLRFRVVDLESQVAFLRSMDKELHPEAYQYSFRQT
jgi:chromosome segregation ATPase